MEAEIKRFNVVLPSMKNYFKSSGAENNSPEAVLGRWPRNILSPFYCCNKHFGSPGLRGDTYWYRFLLYYLQTCRISLLLIIISVLVFAVLRSHKALTCKWALKLINKFCCGMPCNGMDSRFDVFNAIFVPYFAVMLMYALDLLQVCIHIKKKIQYMQVDLPVIQDCFYDVNKIPFCLLALINMYFEAL